MGGPNKCQNGRCFIPEGTFKMGSPKGVGDSDERPQREVTQSAFWLKKTEVTVGEYRKYLETSGSQLKAILSGCKGSGASIVLEGKTVETEFQLHLRAAQVFVSESCKKLNLVGETPKETPKMPNFTANKKGDNYPVVGLTHDERQTYCQAQGGDLPTAAQLERASKGKSGTDEYGTPSDKAITWSNGYHLTAPVCGPNDERANSFGVCDLAGNVWEATRDAYDKDFYRSMPAKDPHKPLTDPNKQYVEFRGGSWNYYQWFARAANRVSINPVNRRVNDGFRCAWPQDSNK